MPETDSKIQKSNLGITMDLDLSKDSESKSHLLGDFILNSGTENVKDFDIFVDELVLYVK